MLLEGVLRGTGLNLKLASPKQIQYQNGILFINNNDGKQAELLESCLLELHQNELLDLEDNVLRVLLTMSDEQRCFNDIRSIFIAHNKKLLSVLSGFFGLDVLRELSRPLNYSNSNNENLSLLTKNLVEGVTPTVPLSVLSTNYSGLSPIANKNSGLAFVGGSFDPVTRNPQLIYKPAGSGKGQGILIS